MTAARIEAKKLIEYFYGKEIEDGMNLELENDENYFKAKKQAEFCAAKMMNIIPTLKCNVKNKVLTIDILGEIDKL